MENTEIKFYPETMSAILPLTKEKFGSEKVRQIALGRKPKAKYMPTFLNPVYKYTHLDVG